jgi:hypothetical protein
VLKTFGELVCRARRGVVLTAGGFIMNRDMVRTHAPDLKRCMFLVGSDGDDGSGSSHGRRRVANIMGPSRCRSFASRDGHSPQRARSAFRQREFLLRSARQHVMYRQDGKAASR